MLKSLEVFGFKSFADRLTFEFAPGLTGVVGPNGSGKSNVVDSIKWILGDQSPKSLRGKDMSDVIFNGSSGRKGANFAEATLTFDNSTGFLPTDRQEVKVGRRLWKNGEAEYLLNGSSARLKDVRELFLGTGAGASAYAIIEQGRVDQILQANATSRRLVFEEAAGISRYKSRKVDAQKKLERVEQNLLRLKDIVDELGGQLSGLRSQAEKATKFRDLSQELKTWWLGLSADDYRAFRQEIQQLQAQIDGQEEHSQQVQEEQAAIQQSLARLEEQIQALETQLRKIEQKSSQNREHIADHKATIRHQQGLENVLDTELASVRRQKAIIENRLQETRAEIAHTDSVILTQKDQVAGAKQEIESRTGSIDLLKQELDKLRENLSGHRATLLSKMRRVSDLASRFQQLQQKIEQQKITAEEVQNRRVDFQERIEQARQAVQEAQTKLDEAQDQANMAREQLLSLKACQTSLAMEHDALKQGLSEKREQRSAWQARISVLEDLEQRQEGWGIGVKDILRRAATCEYPPWNRILGTVADLLKVDLRQAPLIDIALGSRAQLVVIQEFDSLFEYLQSGTARIIGRVGFLSVSHTAQTVRRWMVSEGSATELPERTRANRLHQEELRADPRVLVRADELVRTPEHLAILAEDLLGDTWIVDRLQTAIELSERFPQGNRFVTLQGELWEPDGSMYVGSVRNEPQVVSRKSELRQLKNDFARLESGIVRQEEQLVKITVALDEKQSEIRSAEVNLEEQLQLVEQARELHALPRQELTQLLKEDHALKSQQERIRKQQEESLHEIVHLQHQHEAAERELQQLQADISKRDQAIAQHEQHLQVEERSITQARMELAKQEERVRSLEKSRERLHEDHHQRKLQHAEIGQRLQQVGLRGRHSLLQVLNSSNMLAEELVIKELLDVERERVSKQLNRTRSERAAQVSAEQSLQKRMKAAEEQLHQAQLRIHNLEHQIETLRERIAEEYQVDLDELASSEISGFELYRQEFQQGGKPTGFDEDEDQPSEAEAAETHTPEEVRRAIEERVNRLRRKLKAMGNISSESLQNLDELEGRFQTLNEQLQDLVEARNALDEIVKKANTESKRLFADTFDAIRGHFQDIYRKLFGGGEGDIILEDPNDILDCGIEIVARPPGKELRSISLLSGGEKTLTAVALLLAIFKSKPSPFCILDEVDAALDDANIDRFLRVIKEFLVTTQFIMITHRKPSMSAADVLYGITMEQSGVSKKMSVRFEDVDESGQFIPSSRNDAA